MERDSAMQRADLRLHGVERGPQLRIGRDRFQEPDDAHRIVQWLGQQVERAHSAVKGPLAGRGREGVQPRARIPQQYGDSGLRASKKVIRSNGTRNSMESRGFVALVLDTFSSVTSPRGGPGRIPQCEKATKTVTIEGMGFESDGGRCPLLRRRAAQCIRPGNFSPRLWDSFSTTFTGTRPPLEPTCPRRACCLRGPWASIGRSPSEQARALIEGWAPFYVELAKSRFFPKPMSYTSRLAGEHRS